MPPEGASPEDPREWLRRARSNLEDYEKAVAAARAVVSWAGGIVAAQYET